MPNHEPYCGVEIQKIRGYYDVNIYTNITIPICLAGMILNLLNILIYTRKTMNSPPNLILVHLAAADFLYLLERIVHVWMKFILPNSGIDRKQSYALTLLYFYNKTSLDTFQFISAFLTVQLAAWRYIAIVHPLKERHWCNQKITRNVVIIGYIVGCVLSALPDYLSSDVEKSDIAGKPHYVFTSERHPIMNLIGKINYALMKVLPSVVLLGLTSRLVVTLLARKTRRERLASSVRIGSNMQNAEMRQQTNRSTAILLTIAALFFIAEFPRGILWLLKTINEHDWRICYYSFRQIFITIINIHVSITFIVYYTLSQQFRTTFKSLFSRNHCRNPRTIIPHQTVA